MTIIGLGAFACIGAMNGIRAHVSMPLCVLCAMSTGTFGGAVRDVLTRRPEGVRIFHSYTDIYATCAGVHIILSNHLFTDRHSNMLLT